MKPLVVVAIILLPFSANTWAAEELPIELTCEIGAWIVYYNITGNPETTWYQNHSSNFEGWIFDYESRPDRNQVRDVFVSENSIYIHNGGRGAFGTLSYFNRLTGRMFYNGGTQLGYSISGHCTEGFKEYENNLF